VTAGRTGVNIKSAPGDAAETPTAALPSIPGFKELYDSEFLYVWNTLRRLGIAPQDLEDVAHEVFVAVFHRLPSYDPNRPLRPWIFGVAYRTVLEQRRRLRNRRESALAAELADPEPRADEGLQGHEERALVLEAMGSIQEERKAIFVMFELDGQSMPEIAATLGLPVNTAYSRLRLARKEFADAVRFLRLKRGES
jgi:RNA polymerase sigma-70 factor (ECF subfamily)